MNERRGQLAIALIPAAGQQRRRGVDAALAAVGRAHVQPRHAAIVCEEGLDRRVPQDLAPRAEDDLLARRDVGGGVDAPATAVAQDLHLVGDGDTQRLHPVHGVGESGDECVAQRRVAVRVDVGEHLVRRRRPEVAGVAGRPAELAGPLDDDDGRAVAAGAGCGGETGHAATDDGEIELLRGIGHTPRIVDVTDDVKSSS